MGIDFFVKPSRNVRVGRTGGLGGWREFNSLLNVGKVNRTDTELTQGAQLAKEHVPEMATRR